MKRRILAWLLVLCMVASLMPTIALAEGEGANCTEGCSDSSAHVAAIGTTHYTSLQDAINAATSGATVTLLKSTKESVTVAVGQSITLDTAGFTLTNSGDTDTITNNGTLSISDSSYSKHTNYLDAVVGSADYTDASVVNTSEGKAAVLNKGTLNGLEGVFTHDPDVAGYALYNDSATAATVSGGTTYFEGGSPSILNTEGSNLTISGGFVNKKTTGHEAVVNYGTANVRGFIYGGVVADGATSVTNIEATCYNTSENDYAVKAINGTVTLNRGTYWAKFANSVAVLVGTGAESSNPAVTFQSGIIYGVTDNTGDIGVLVQSGTANFLDENTMQVGASEYLDYGVKVTGGVANFESGSSYFAKVHFILALGGTTNIGTVAFYGYKDSAIQIGSATDTTAKPEVVFTNITNHSRYIYGYTTPGIKIDSGTVKIEGGDFSSAHLTEDSINKTNTANPPKVTITGGEKYTFDVSEYVPDGYICKVDGETYKVVESERIQVDGKTYDDVEAAISAANVSGTHTMKLLDNVKYPSGITFEADTDLTIDLNGKTLTGYITNNGTLTINDSSKTANAEGTGKISNSSGNAVQTYTGKLVVNGGTLESGSYRAIYAESGTLEINGGTFKSTNSHAIWIGSTSCSPSVTIAGGTFSAGSLAVYVQSGTVLISGGEFSSTNNNAVYTDSGNTTITGGQFTSAKYSAVYRYGGTLTVQGGTYNTNPSSYVDGTHIAVLTNGKYVVQELTMENAVAKIGDTPYNTIENALSAAVSTSESTTVTLLKDVTVTSLIKLTGGDITLDLNGHTVTASNIYGFGWVNTGATLTITDSSENEEAGKIVGTNSGMVYGTVIGNGGTLTIEKVTISSTVKPAVAVYGGTTTINSGTFTSTSSTAIVAYNSTPVTISGGTFSSDPNAYVEDGKVAVLKDGMYTVETMADDNAVAKIGSTYYNSLAKAISAAKSGDTITMLKDVALDSYIQISDGKTLTIDLGGHTLSEINGGESGLIWVYNSNVTVKNGKVEGEMGFLLYGTTTDVKDYSVLTIESNVTVDADYALYVYRPNSSTNVTYGAVANIYGTLNGLIFIDGNIGNTEASGEAMKKAENPCTVNLYKGAKVTFDESVGIQMGGYAVVNVESGATVSGGTGVAIKRGVLNVNGGTILATGDMEDPVAANNNGSESSGAAISITSTYNAYGHIDVNVKDGSTITSTNNAAVYMGHSSNNGKSIAFVKGASINITGGTFIGGGDDSTAVFIAENVEASTISITGGTFSSNVTTYCADGYACNEVEAKYTVGSRTTAADDSVAVVNGQYFKELANAVTAAGTTASTIKLLKDVSESVTVAAGQNITLDLNGKTITGNVSSAGALTITDSAETVGTVDGTLEKTGSGTLTVNAGKFTNDPNAYCAEGYVAVKDGSTYTVRAVSEDGSKDVAVVEKGAAYDSLQDAINAAAEDGTVKLLKDVVVNSDNPNTIAFTTSKNVTIDLNGHNITGYNARVFQVKAGTLTLTGKGTVQTLEITLSSKSVIRVGDDNGAANTAAGLVVGKDVTIYTDSCYGVSVFGSKTIETVEVSGTITSMAGAISGNGSAAYGGTSIIINATAKLTSKEAAIYHPQSGTLTIKGGEITGATGIEIKSGNTTIEVSGNPTITATGVKKHEACNDGNSTTGYAIAVAENKNYTGGSTVIIGSGTYNGPVAILKDNEVSDAQKGSITISGGTFNGAVETEDGVKGSITISGGTFSVDPSAYVTDNNLVAVKNSDDTYTVEALNATNGEASVTVGSEAAVGYKTLKAAVEAANAATDDAVITLNKNVTVTSCLTINNSSHKITLDLGEHTLSRNGNSVLDVYSALTIKNGTVKMTGGSSKSTIWVNKTAQLTIDSDATINASQSVPKDGTQTSSHEYSSFAISYWGGGTSHDGNECTGAKVTLKGKITGENGITINGLLTTDKAYATLEIADGASIDVTVTGLYLAGLGTTTVGAATISGETGIEVRAGELTVNDGATVKGGNGVLTANPNNNGQTTYNAALAIAQHTTKKDITVTINGGTFSGTYALYESNAQKNAPAPKVTMSITGGKFSGKIHSDDYETAFISGGYFSRQPSSSYIVSGSSAQTDTTYSGYFFKVDTTPDKEENTAIEEKTAHGETTAAEVKTDDVKGFENATTAAAEAKTAAESVAVPDTSVSVLSNTAADQVTYNIEATEIQNKIDSLGAEENETVTIYTQTYMDVETTEYKAETKTSEQGGQGTTVYSLTMEITPMVKVVASTADNADSINLGVEGNAVEIVAAQELTVTEPVEVSVQLPEVFKSQTIYIIHEAASGTYVYKAETNASGTLTFTTKDGFSPFTFTTEDPTVAYFGVSTDDESEITKFPSLQDAVNAVSAKDQVITIGKDNDEAITVSRAISFEIVGGTTKIAAGANYTMATSDGENGGTLYTFTYVGISSGGKDDDDDEEEEVPSFTDVPEGQWYSDAVAYCAANGLMDGVGDGKFEPFTTVTRGMAITTLYRMAGSPEVSGSNSFTDLTQDWYKTAVQWGVNVGITDGVSATEFDPEGAITREQLATMLYRYASVMGIDVSEKNDLGGYTDSAKISDFAIDAMQWANAAGLITGVTNTTLVPTADSDRATLATILMRFCESNKAE